MTEPNYEAPSLRAALAYARLGFHVFPIAPGEKTPLTAHGFHDATRDEARIRAWWAATPAAGVGIATGEVSGILVLDVDPRAGGDEELRAHTAKHGLLPTTVACVTGGGGSHFYFAAPSPCPRSFDLAPGLEIKATGSYVVAPFSIHPSGRRYEWEPGFAPGPRPLAAAPAWLLSPNGYRKTQPTPAFEEGAAGYSEGARNKALASLAGTMQRRGMAPEAVLQALLVENALQCHPPLPESEVRAVVASITTRYAPSDPLPGVTDAGLPKRTWNETSSRDLLRGDDEPVAWLAEGLLAREELAILTAPPKSLKTWVELAIAVHAALGRPVLGRFHVEHPCRVLLGDEEMGIRKIRRRLQRLTRGLRLTDAEVDQVVENLRVFPQQGMALKSPEERRGFFDAVERFRPDLVVLDSFAGFTTGLDDDNSTRRSFYGQALAPLKEKYGAAVLLLAHPPLPGKEVHADAHKRPRGGGDILGVADRALYMEKMGEERVVYGMKALGTLGEYLVRELGGLTEPAIVTVEDVPDDGTVVTASPSTAASGAFAETGRCQIEILHRLRSAPDGSVYQPDLIREMEDLGFSKRHVYRPAIEALEKLGQIELKQAPNQKGKLVVLKP